ncbi:hypothetical protein [Thomasclavelia cocleata]|uniref:Uncharacterized protein n=1 Tax=Thomasclavelia cocleata TaxID=69824 RepID=A0A1I0GDH8_9FIRM|nr:hypothetical protein [Thomasclavelia cocleata]MCR1959864.1 hypothetical protein [Thomasclavelia cocleata]SET68884.1 hypothetical protein SAMN04489758_12840 [Thomasclavelia cocleata]
MDVVVTTIGYVIGVGGIVCAIIKICQEKHDNSKYMIIMMACVAIIYITNLIAESIR